MFLTAKLENCFCCQFKRSNHNQVITSDKLIYEKRKENIVIDRSNFGRAVTNKAYMYNSAQIFLKDSQKPVFSCSLNGPNARLIVPVVNYFFGNGAEES